MSIKFYSRPADRSLQAFKNWMQGYRLTSQAENIIATKQWIDEKNWIDHWKKFWAKVDGASPARRSNEE